MKVITQKSKVIVLTKSNQALLARDYFSSLDGTSVASEIKAFQTYAISKGATSVTADGKWGPKTKAAWQKYGADFTKSTAASAPSVAPGTTPTADQVKTQAAKGNKWDKAKGTWVKAKDAGVIDGAKDMVMGWLGKKSTDTGAGDVPVDTGSGDTGAKPKEPMSTTTKVLIGVGAAVVLGIVIYAATRPAAAAPVVAKAA